MVLVTMMRFNEGGALEQTIFTHTDEPVDVYASMVFAAHGWIVRTGNAGAVILTYSDARPPRLVTVATPGNWQNEGLEELRVGAKH